MKVSKEFEYCIKFTGDKHLQFMKEIVAAAWAYGGSKEKLQFAADLLDCLKICEGK